MAFESDLAEVTNGGKIAVTVQTDMKKIVDLTPEFIVGGMSEKRSSRI